MTERDRPTGVAPAPSRVRIRALISAVFVGGAIYLVFNSVPIALIAGAIAFLGGLSTYGGGVKPLGSHARIILTAIVIISATLLVWLLRLVVSVPR